MPSSQHILRLSGHVFHDFLAAWSETGLRLSPKLSATRHWVCAQGTMCVCELLPRCNHSFLSSWGFGMVDQLARPPCNFHESICSFIGGLLVLLSSLRGSWVILGGGEEQNVTLSGAHIWGTLGPSLEA